MPDTRSTPAATDAPSVGANATTQLAWAVGLALLGALGAWPLERNGPLSGPDPLFALVWSALLAPLAGAAAGRARLTPWSFGLAAPAAWIGALLWASTDSPRLAPTPLWGACAWMGLFALAAAAVRSARSGSVAYGVALVASALACAPWASAATGELLPVGLAQTLFDIAPPTLVVECAGLDWMRADFVYEAAQTDRFTRAPWRGELAGPALLVLGYSTWAAVEALARRRAAPPPSAPGTPWPPASTSAPFRST